MTIQKTSKVTHTGEAVYWNPFTESYESVAKAIEAGHAERSRAFRDAARALLQFLSFKDFTFKRDHAGHQDPFATPNAHGS